MDIKEFAENIGIANEHTITVCGVFKCGSQYHLKIPKEVVGMLEFASEDGLDLPGKITFKSLNGNIFIRKSKEGDYGKL